MNFIAVNGSPYISIMNSARNQISDQILTRYCLYHREPAPNKLKSRISFGPRYQYSNGYSSLLY